MFSITLNPTTSELTGIFPVIAWILLTWMDMSKRLNLPCAWAIPSPSLSLASRHSHFPPHLLRFIFLLGCLLLLPALRLLRQVLLTPKATQDFQRTATSLV